MQLKLVVPWPLTPLAAEQLTNSLPFLDEAVIRFHVNLEENCVEVECSDHEERVHERLESLVEKHRPLRKGDLVRVAYDQSALQVPCRTDVFAELLTRGDLYEHSPGIFSLSGQVLEMYRTLDNHLLHFAKTQQARDTVLPITTSLQTLNRADFFNRTPQFAQFMSTFREDSQTILDFADGLRSHGEQFDFRTQLHVPRHMCRSAICLSSYPQFEGRTLSESDFASWTVIGKAFRNEATNVASLERLYEFSMREIIYFGNRDFVASRLTECMNWFVERMKDWGIQGAIQTANDPFFAEKIQALQFYQLAEQSKYEIRWNNPWSGNAVSVGSVNNHGAHFSKAYNIRLVDGTFATTGCVGFGYERLIFLVLSQFGLDVTSWPTSLREFWRS